jgi:hypothetical protein
MKEIFSRRLRNAYVKWAGMLLERYRIRENSIDFYKNVNFMKKHLKTIRQLRNCKGLDLSLL